MFIIDLPSLSTLMQQTRGHKTASPKIF